MWECELCLEKIPIHAEQNVNDFNRIKTHLEDHARNSETVKCPFFRDSKVCSRPFLLYKSLNKHLNTHKQRSEFNVIQNNASETPPELVIDDTNNLTPAPQVSDWPADISD